MKLGDLSKAIEQCTKAIQTDRTSMKAHFRRGQAFMRMGDLPKAKDDLMVAARRAPDSREVRAELEEVRRLEAEEEEGAKELWKQNFITEQMSFRAQQGAASVSEALAKTAGGVNMEEVDEEEEDVVLEEVEEEGGGKSTGVGSLAKGFLKKPNARAVEEDDESSDDDVSATWLMPQESNIRP